MSGVELRDLGTTAVYAPRIKRGTARLSDGRAVVVVPDTNRSTANGDDVTGTAKMFIYLSTDANRTAYTLDRTHTTGTAFASSTRYAVMSITVRENNDLYVVYQGTDNSLRFISFAWSGSTYAAGSEQTIVAAGAISVRFRQVDIDAIQPSANPVVAAYEGAATSGQGAFARVYVRMNDNVTWTRAYTHTILSTEFIKYDSEDISIACNKAGVSSNVIQMALYWTGAYTGGDKGDTLREISFNVSTGTTDSATVIGSWRTDLYKNNAAGSRKGILFSEANNVWMFGAAVGSSVSFFSGVRLYHNVFTGLIHNQTTVSTITYSDPFMRIVRTSNAFTAVSMEYCDYDLVFAFVGTGRLVEQVARSVVISFSSTTSDATATRKDTASRVLDHGYSITAYPTVIATYGGGNKNLTSGLNTYTFGVIYGATGDSVSSTAGVLSRKFRAVAEDVHAKPVILSPNGTTITTDHPTVRVQAQNADLYTSVLGKLEFQVASDSAFTTNLQTFTEADSQFNSFSATSGTVPPIRTLQYTVESGLFSGTWYLRARVLDDLGGASAWSDTSTFIISHPPVPLIVSPANGVSALYGSGDVVFNWQFTDPEPTDSQSARQIVVTRVDTGAIIYDSGKVVTSATTYTLTGVSASLKDIPLQWSIILWDSDDTQGPASTGTVFTLVDPPDVVVTGPTEGGTINTALPTVTWTFTAGGTRTQRAYRVRIWDTDASPDEEVHDTGWVFSDAVTWTSQEQILEEGVNYRADVYVQDTLGLGDNDSNAFITDWLPPIELTSLAVAVDEFKATITWDDTDNDTDWVGYRIYRRYMKPAIPELDLDLTATTWELIGEATDVATSYTHYDYTLPLNKVVDYVVVQVADRFGSLLESDITSYESVTSPGDRYYFVPENPIGSIASFEASNVVGDSFTREVEQNTLHVLSRGRQVQVGDDLGYTGTLTIHLRNPDTARSDREFIEYLSGSTAGNVYIRSPFGDVLYISFGNVGFSRMAGVGGGADLGDLTVPYTTVIQEVPLKRAGV